jgi:hypothetical protein
MCVATLSLKVYDFSTMNFANKILRFLKQIHTIKNYAIKEQKIQSNLVFIYFTKDMC